MGDSTSLYVFDPKVARILKKRLESSNPDLKMCMSLNVESLYLECLSCLIMNGENFCV